MEFGRQLGVPAIEEHEKINHKLLWFWTSPSGQQGVTGEFFDQGPEMTIFVYKIKKDERLERVILETRD